MRSRLVSTTLAAMIVATCAQAKDLGTEGRTFPIIEQDIMAYLKAKLDAAQASGKIDELNRQFADRAKARIERPTPVAGLVHTTQPRSFLFDPSIVVPQDYADQNGRVFARRGERINPLARMPAFNQTLIFIDGDDPKQVAFGLARLRRAGVEQGRVILVKGAPLELMRKAKTPLFFDQEGRLTEHFGLRQVPAIVSREGDMLRVSEVLP